MRGHGFAKAVVSGLVEACGENTLYMHSVLNLVNFYRQFGFVPIEEKDLPPTIRDRYAWAGGQTGRCRCPADEEGSISLIPFSCVFHISREIRIADPIVCQNSSCYRFDYP